MPDIKSGIAQTLFDLAHIQERSNQRNIEKVKSKGHGNKK